MNNKTIIGLAGRKQSGKTTAAKYLENSGFVRLSFADPIKNMLASLLVDCGYVPADIEQMLSTGKELMIAPMNKSPRHLLQTLGTEWGRNCIDDDLWVLIAKQNSLSADSDYIVFDDVRFENEAAMIRDMGGLIIHIDRGDLVTAEHVSELGIDDHADDAFIDNDYSLKDFLLDVQIVVAGHIGR